MGASQETAIGAYVGKISPLFPEMAARWAKAIEDETIRAREMERVAEVWMLSDEKTARAWIAKGGLSHTTKHRLLGAEAQ